MNYITSNELTRKDFPIELFQDSFYCLFFKNKTIQVDIINGYHLLMNFIFEDESGKRNYSYESTRFEESPDYQRYQDRKFDFKNFKYTILKEIQECVFSYADEKTIKKIINTFGSTKNKNNKKGFEKIVFIPDVEFSSNPMHKGHPDREFTIFKKSLKNTEKRYEFSYAINKKYISQIIQDPLQTEFPYILKFLKYSKIDFAYHKRLFENDFNFSLLAKNDFLSVFYIEGELFVRGRYFSKKSSNPEDIEKLLFYVVRIHLQYSHTSKFMNLAVDNNIDLETLSTNELKLIDIMDLS